MALSDTAFYTGYSYPARGINLVVLVLKGLETPVSKGTRELDN